MHLDLHDARRPLCCRPRQRYDPGHSKARRTDCKRLPTQPSQLGSGVLLCGSDRGDPTPPQPCCSVFHPHAALPQPCSLAHSARLALLTGRAPSAASIATAMHHGVRPTASSLRTLDRPVVPFWVPPSPNKRSPHMPLSCASAALGRSRRHPERLEAPHSKTARRYEQAGLRVGG